MNEWDYQRNTQIHIHYTFIVLLNVFHTVVSGAVLILLVKNSHMTWNIQSECLLISAQRRFVYDTGSS